MPPEDSPQPTASEVGPAIALDQGERWNATIASRPPNPGRVTIRRLNRAEYNNTIRDLFGVDDRPADDFPSDDVGYGFDNIGRRPEPAAAADGAVPGRGRDDRRTGDRRRRRTGAAAAEPESHRRILFREPTSPGEYPDAARAILERFASRAYRRPVTAEETGPAPGPRRDGAGRNGESFEAGIQLAVQAVLVSPHFLFRVELDNRPRGTDAGGSAGRTVPSRSASIELASRLSYFLWSTMPDEELFRLAAEGKLRSTRGARRPGPSDARRPQGPGARGELRRAVAPDPQPQVARPDRERFPGFDESLREAMFRETELFLAEIIREDRSILDLLDADFTYVNERLARHYGIGGDHGRRVPPGPTERIRREAAS